MEDINGDSIIDIKDLNSFSPRRHKTKLQANTETVYNQILTAILENRQSDLTSLATNYPKGVVGSYDFSEFIKDEITLYNFIVSGWFIEEDIVYVVGTDRDAADNNFIFLIIDVSAPSDAQLIEKIVLRDLAIDGDATSIRKSDNYLYIAVRGVGMYVVDITDIQNPIATLVINNSDIYALEVVQDDFLYISFFNFSSDIESIISIYDISDPLNPALQQTLHDYLAFDMIAEGEYLYTYGREGLIDISSPASPAVLNSTSFPSSGSAPFAVKDGFTYFPVQEGAYNGLKVFNSTLNGFGNFTDITNINSPGDIFVSDDLLHVVISLDHPENLVLTYRITEPGSIRLQNAHKLNLIGSFASNSTYHFIRSTTKFSIFNKSKFSSSPDPDINKAPIFTSRGETSLDEERTYEFYTAKAVDIENDPITFSLVEGDIDFFTIDPISGRLRVSTPLDFEFESDSDLDNYYDLIISACDTNGDCSYLDFSVDVYDIDEAAIPEILSYTSISVEENYQDTFYIAQAENSYNSPMRYILIDSGDSRYFEIDRNTGQLQFTTSQQPSFEEPLDSNGDNIYELEISVLVSGHNAAKNYFLNVTVTDTTNLTLELTYPTNGANFGGLVNSTPLSGNLVDLADEGVSVDELNYIDIDGQSFAVQDIENPARWRGSLALNLSDTSPLLTVRDSSDNENSINPIFHNDPILTVPYSIIYDNTDDVAYISDLAANSIYKFDLDTDELSMFSGPITGAGPEFIDITSMILDFDNNRLIVADASQAMIMEVDLSTGNRNILLESDTGNGPAFVTPLSILWDADNDQLLVLDQKAGSDGNDALLEVDLNTGNRSYISEVNTGNGADIGNLGIMVLDQTTNSVIVPDAINDHLIAIDLSNGNRTIISDNDIHPGDDFVFPFFAFPSPNDDEVFVNDGKNLLSVTLSTGERSIVSGTGVGDGEFYSLSQGTILDVYNLLLLDRSMMSLYRVNISTGNRTLLYSNLVGGGEPQFSTFPMISTGLAFDKENNRLFVSSPSFYIGSPTGSILSIDSSTGYRSTYSTGAAVPFNNPTDLAIDPISGDLIVADFYLDEIRRIDPDTQENSILTDLSCYSPPTPSGMVIDEVNQLLYFVDYQGALIQVDMNSGACGLLATGISDVAWGLVLDANNNRIIFSDPSTSSLHAIDLSTYVVTEFSSALVGTGPEFNSPMDLFLDEENNLLYVADGQECAIYIVDMTTGNREYLSSHEIGSGPLFIYPTDLVVDIENNRAFVFDQRMRGIFVVDLETGNRAITSMRLEYLQ